MRLAAYLFSSGDVLFLGAALMLTALALSCRVKTGLRAAIVRTLSVVGSMLVAAAAVPFPAWFYALWTLTLCSWLFVEAGRRNWPKRPVVALRFAIAGCTLTAPLWELAWQAAQAVEPGTASTLYVVGDSLSAGLSANEQQTWPQRLHNERHVKVIDLSQVGATARSALRQADAIDRGDAIVLIEVGGNDILGETSINQFAIDLEALLVRLHKPGRQLVMLELPLPPFYNGYGTIQRTLSRRHGVVLIPRREFARVIFSQGATSDGLHFSEKGHRLMADMIWEKLSPSLSTAQSSR